MIISNNPLAEFWLPVSTILSSVDFKVLIPKGERNASTKGHISNSIELTDETATWPFWSPPATDSAGMKKRYSSLQRWMGDWAQCQEGMELLLYHGACRTCLEPKRVPGMSLDFHVQWRKSMKISTTPQNGKDTEDSELPRVNACVPWPGKRKPRGGCGEASSSMSAPSSRPATEWGLPELGPCASALCLCVRIHDLPLLSPSWLMQAFWAVRDFGVNQGWIPSLQLF